MAKQTSRTSSKGSSDSGESPAYTIGHLASQMIMLLNLNLNK